MRRRRLFHILVYGLLRVPCRLSPLACRLFLPLLCLLLLAAPVGGLALWVQVQQAGYADVCVPVPAVLAPSSSTSSLCVWVMPGDVELSWPS